MRATFETFSFWSESVRALTGNNFFCLLPSLSNPKSYTIIKDHFYKMWIYSIFELLFLWDPRSGKVCRVEGFFSIIIFKNCILYRYLQYFKSVYFENKQHIFRAGETTENIFNVLPVNRTWSVGEKISIIKIYQAITCKKCWSSQKKIELENETFHFFETQIISDVKFD